MLDSGESAQIEARVRYFLALSQLQLGRPDRARSHLDASRNYYETTRDAERLVECMATEISYANVTRSPDAVEIGRHALACCRRLKPVPTMLEVRILNMLASAYVDACAWTEAVDACERALELAGPLFDLKRQARLFGDIGIAYKELGLLDRALRYGTRAVALLEVTREPVMLAWAENCLGYTLLATGDLVAARQHLERSLALHEETGVEVMKSHLLLSLCELSLAEGRPDAARDWARRALELAARLGERSAGAQAHHWLGKIAADAGDAATSDAEFAEALRGWSALGAKEWLARCHELYGDVLQKRGDLGEANAQLKMAVAVRSGARPNPLDVI